MARMLWQIKRVKSWSSIWVLIPVAVLLTVVITVSDVFMLEVGKKIDPDGDGPRRSWRGRSGSRWTAGWPVWLRLPGPPPMPPTSGGGGMAVGKSVSRRQHEVNKRSVALLLLALEDSCLDWCELIGAAGPSPPTQSSPRSTLESTAMESKSTHPFEEQRHQEMAGGMSGSRSTIPTKAVETEDRSRRPAMEEEEDLQWGEANEGEHDGHHHGDGGGAPGYYRRHVEVAEDLLRALRNSNSSMNTITETASGVALYIEAATTAMARVTVVDMAEEEGEEEEVSNTNTNDKLKRKDTGRGVRWREKDREDGRRGGVSSSDFAAPSSYIMKEEEEEEEEEEEGREEKEKRSARGTALDHLMMMMPSPIELLCRDGDRFSPSESASAAISGKQQGNKSVAIPTAQLDPNETKVWPQNPRVDPSSYRSAPIPTRGRSYHRWAAGMVPFVSHLRHTVLHTLYRFQSLVSNQTTSHPPPPPPPPSSSSGWEDLSNHGDRSRENVVDIAASAAADNDDDDDDDDDANQKMERMEMVEGMGAFGRLSDEDIELLELASERARYAPRIAFLFLVKNSVPLAAFWQNFFHGYDDFYSVYVHSGDPFSENLTTGASSSSSSSPSPSSSSLRFADHVIPSKPVQWGSPTIINAERRLLAHALLDPLNQHFVLVSESCIPIRSFPFIYTYLISTSRSFVAGGVNAERYPSKLSSVLGPDQFRQGSQWLTLARPHATLVVSDVTFYAPFATWCRGLPKRYCLVMRNRTKCASFPEKVCFSDEHYIQSLVHVKDPDHVNSRSLTWTHWDLPSPHPKTYGVDDTSAALLEEMRSQKYCEWNGQTNRECFLFARKFAPETLSALLSIGEKVGIWRSEKNEEGEGKQSAVAGGGEGGGGGVGGGGGGGGGKREGENAREVVAAPASMEEEGRRKKGEGNERE